MKSREDQCILLVSDDEYQLPILTADSLKELSAVLGVAYSTVYNAAKNQTAIRLPKGRFEHFRKGRVVRIDLSEE